MRKNLGRIYHVLGGSQPRFLRLLFAWVAWAATLALTFDLKVSALASGHFRENRFKIGFRFSAWIVQYSWLSRPVAYDPMFVCSLFLEPEDLEALARFVQRRSPFAENFLVSSDLACIYGALAQFALLNGHIEQFQAWRADHAEAMSEGLQLVHGVGPRRRRLAEEVGRRGRVVLPASADSAIEDFASACNSIRLRWFAVSGTFLGVVREKDWIAHDYDIDVGVMGNTFSLSALINALTSKGQFRIIKVDDQVRFFGPDDALNIEEVPACLKLEHRNGVPVDVFIHYNQGDVHWHGSSMNRWDNSLFELSEYSFRGFNILGPSDYDRYLTENYGSDWRVPRVDFHSTDGSGTPNLVLVKNLVILGICLKRLSCVDERTRRHIAGMMLELDAIEVKDGGWVYNKGFCSRPAAVQSD